MTRYREFHRRSIETPEDFWRDEARRIHWETPFEMVLDRSNPPFARWFVGGRTSYVPPGPRRLAAAERGGVSWVRAWACCVP